MKKIHTLISYFTMQERIIWCSSVFLILLSFVLFDRANYMTLTASLIGATSLMFNAKGNPFGQFLTIVFSLIYGAISYSCSYYGEMVTYLGMTAPMALFSLISWMKNPFQGNKAEVAVNHLEKKEIAFMLLLTALVTYLFYFILKAFDTANLLPSTLSVTTSFLAVYLTFRRSAYYAIAYAANDIILILLWIMATIENISYLSVIICFVVFLINDIYGFLNWKKMHVRQINSYEA